MTKYYLTFTDTAKAKNGMPLKDYYLLVLADSKSAAINRAKDRYPSALKACFDEKEFQGKAVQYKKGRLETL
jgi:hypothetical protein